MKKSQTKELYIKYLWKKCSLSTYYARIKLWIPPLEALKPIEKKVDIRSKRFNDELQRYYKQPKPKPEKTTFYQRLYKWYSKEEAIMVDLFKKERKPLNYNYRTYEPTYELWKNKVNEDHIWIWIKYNKEESNVIKKEYEKMIHELESLIVEDEQERKSLDTRIEELKKEYHDFISINKDE